MSENLKRSNPDFSKYDSMSIGELEEILRADAMGPERDDSDVDEILYVMEVLAKKRRQNGIAGKTALEAYQEFQQHYLPMVEEESQPKRKSNVIPFRRIAAVAACLVLVFSLTTTANAFSFRDVWEAVAKWAEETFSFYIGAEYIEPTPKEMIEYESLNDILEKNNRDTSCVPRWIPKGYILDDIVISETPMQETYVAIYLYEDRLLKISLQSYLSSIPEKIEFSDEILEIYTVSGIDYYIMKNNNLTQAAWITQNYECYISGELTTEEIKIMIDSIGKG